MIKLSLFKINKYTSQLWHIYLILILFNCREMIQLSLMGQFVYIDLGYKSFGYSFITICKVAFKFCDTNCYNLKNLGATDCNESQLKLNFSPIWWILLLCCLWDTLVIIQKRSDNLSFNAWMYKMMCLCK